MKHLSELRIKEAKKMLLNTNIQIKEISMSVGYKNVFYFDRVFKNYTGITPSEFRAQNIDLLNLK